MLKVATWNVNSVRARLERVLDWLEREAPTVVCLQEIKTQVETFPFDALREAGYEAAVHGQKTYNGVAVLSRAGLDDVVRGWAEEPEDEQARLVAATVEGVRVVSVYVPLGTEVGSEKWAYKMAWLKRLRGYLERTCRSDEPVVVAGDFNVAPGADDVARPAAWRGSVLFHEDNTEALHEVVGWGLVDVVRRHEAPPGPYTWWDYRRLAFPRDDGLRIDHILATPSLAERSTAAYVDREARKGDKPSDHAPVVAVFDGEAGDEAET